MGKLKEINDLEMGIIQTKLEYKISLIFFSIMLNYSTELLKYLVSDSFKLTITTFIKLLYFLMQVILHSISLDSLRFHLEI